MSKSHQQENGILVLTFGTEIFDVAENLVGRVDLKGRYALMLYFFEPKRWVWHSPITARRRR